MLEKIVGNCNITKLGIILLFKADFNQLNKFIGKEMMHQAEEQWLVAGNSMEVDTEKVPSPKVSTNKWHSTLSDSSKEQQSYAPTMLNPVTIG